MSRAVKLRLPSGGGSCLLARDPVRVTFPATVQLEKSDAFVVCDALALAEPVLHAAGRREEAIHVARAFELLEAALTQTAHGSRELSPPGRTRWPGS